MADQGAGAADLARAEALASSVELRARLRESMRALVECKRAQLAALPSAFDEALAAGLSDAAAWERVTQITNDGDVRVAVAHAYCLLREERQR